MSDLNYVRQRLSLLHFKCSFPLMTLLQLYLRAGGGNVSLTRCVKSLTLSLCCLHVETWLISRHTEDFSALKKKRNHYYQVLSVAVYRRRTSLVICSSGFTSFAKEQNSQTLSGTSSYVHTIPACAPLKMLETAITSIINKFRAAAAALPGVLLQALSLHP